MAETYLVNDTKYGGGCEEWFGRLPRCGNYQSYRLCYFVVSSWQTAVQPLDFYVTQQTLQCFVAQSTRSPAWLFFSHPHSFFLWLKHQTTNAACSHYSRLTRASELRNLLPQKICATFTLIVSCAWIYVCVCAHPVSENPWQYRRANKRPPVPLR